MQLSTLKNANAMLSGESLAASDRVGGVPPMAGLIGTGTHHLRISR
jgi:hypothetical protein